MDTSNHRDEEAVEAEVAEAVADHEAKVAVLERRLKEKIEAIRAGEL